MTWLCDSTTRSCFLFLDILFSVTQNSHFPSSGHEGPGREHGSVWLIDFDKPSEKQNNKVRSTFCTLGGKLGTLTCPKKDRVSVSVFGDTITMWKLGSTLSDWVSSDDNTTALEDKGLVLIRPEKYSVFYFLKYMSFTHISHILSKICKVYSVY